jgi:hypothetical protein
MSRWENAPTLREILKLSGVLIDFYCVSYATLPQAVALDIDDTCDVALRIMMIAASCRFRSMIPRRGACVVILRPGKTPSGRKYAAIYAGSSVASAHTGQQPISPSGAKAIVAAAR